jgi:hypothetical protein
MLRTLGEQIPGARGLFKRPIAAIAKDGTQGLFRKMAKHLDEQKGTAAVLTGEKVKDITKYKEGLTVTTANNKHEFDKVICAVPPQIVGSLMKFPKEENDLLQMTKYDPYYVGCIDPDHDLKPYYYQNLELNEGDPVQFSKRWDNSPIVAYGYNWKDADKVLSETTLEELRKELKTYCKDNMDINASADLPIHSLWDNYHPHVPIKAFQDAFLISWRRCKESMVST